LTLPKKGGFSDFSAGRKKNIIRLKNLVAGRRGERPTTKGREHLRFLFFHCEKGGTLLPDARHRRGWYFSGVQDRFCRKLSTWELGEP